MGNNVPSAEKYDQPKSLQFILNFKKIAYNLEHWVNTNRNGDSDGDHPGSLLQLSSEPTHHVPSVGML